MILKILYVLRRVKFLSFRQQIVNGLNININSNNDVIFIGCDVIL